jgi:hypothetical protein
MKKWTILDTNDEKLIKERRHNPWIEGLEAGEAFFRLVGNTGYAILILMCVFTALSFWVNFALTNPEYVTTVALFLKIIRLGIWMLMIGVIFSWLCYILSKMLYSRELLIIKREGAQLYGRNKKRKSNKKVN